MRAGMTGPTNSSSKKHTMSITQAALVICIFCFIIFSARTCPAADLYVTDLKGFIFVYPKGEEAITQRLMSVLPDMTKFLYQQNLRISRPLYIYLDEELDIPEVIVSMIPHREIRIPLKAPGVFEEGYLERDPWRYFLFRGLTLQALYSMRGGIPAAAHRVFGEVISPNVVFPGWLEDGIATVLYERYTGRALTDPLSEEIFALSPLPDLAKLSNHPGIWPGHYAYRIFGRPFMRWVIENQGWEKMLEFLHEHGAGIIPIEIDLKANEIFGRTWISLWNEFRATQIRSTPSQGDALIDGFWHDPYIYWNRAGVYPGVELTRYRGRYGYSSGEELWLSEYDGEGVAHVTGYRDGIMLTQDEDSIWDPGMGDVALSRKGHKPRIVFLRKRTGMLRRTTMSSTDDYIDAPPGVIQLSGPVRSNAGTIAVAANLDGNWDIWTYDGQWRRVTSSPSLEIDPWWDGEELRFASNASGSFQIMDAQTGLSLSQTPHSAMMPRGGSYLALSPGGWIINTYEPPPAQTDALLPATAPSLPSTPENETAIIEGAQNYTPWRSLQPNFMVPDIYVGSDLQLGLSTMSRDVSGDYLMNAGFRYSFEDECFSWRLGGIADHTGAQVSRYPLSYSSNLGHTSELRTETKLAYYPFEIDEIEISLNRYHFGPLDDVYGDETGSETWGALALHKRLGSLSLWGTAEAYSGGMRSVYGGASLIWGKEIYGIGRFQAGKSWHDDSLHHGSFRIGGDTGEGYFTQRPSRLFPVRGFSSNIQEADQAMCSSLEIFWPIANLQQGYETLPLFLHRLRLGTFVDAGAAREQLTWDDTLIGAGIEMVISMEVAWGAFSSFRMGAGWPVRQPGYLDEKGPVFLMQLGRPL